MSDHRIEQLERRIQLLDARSKAAAVRLRLRQSIIIGSSVLAAADKGAAYALPVWSRTAPLAASAVLHAIITSLPTTTHKQRRERAVLAPLLHPRAPASAR